MNPNCSKSKIIQQLSISMSRTTIAGTQSLQKETEAIVDNPCWGSPTSCSLSDLLRLVKKENQILFEDSNYVVLNKPADLRMDGNYPSTVDKLLRFWFRDKTTEGLSDPEMLETLHADLAPPSKEASRLRHCHQLDYATSGIVLFARSTAAANRACVAFEQRQVRKTYCALVKGRLEIDPDWPVWTRDQLKKSLETVESNHRLQKRKPETWKGEFFPKESQVYRSHPILKFLGFIPAHALFQKWQYNHSGQPAVKKKRKLATSLDDSSWTKVWNLVESLLSEEDRNVALGSKWKDLKKMSNSQRYLQPFEEAEKLYNQLTPQTPSVALSNPLPATARLSDDSFAVTTPLAVDPNGFAMLIPPGNQYISGSAVGEFKPSVTVATILARCDSATLLKLEPWTGRRHQLRVHCAAIGHAVVGDLTYGTTAERLCLHSTTLQVPGIVDVASEPPFGIRDGSMYINIL